MEKSVNHKPEYLMLSQICQIIGGTMHAQDCGIKCAVYAKDKIEEGCLFFALTERLVETYMDIPLAMEKKAAAIVTEKYIDEYPCIVVEDSFEAYMRLAEWYRSRMDIQVVAITGSIGKTTTKEMTSYVLNNAFCVEQNEGNQNYAAAFAQGIINLNNQTDIYLQEKSVTTHMHQSSVACKPTIAVITNIGYSHVERYGRREDIFYEKMKITDGMDKNGVLILNADDDLLCQFNDDMNRSIITYGIENENVDFRAVDIIKDQEGYNFIICHGKKRQPARINCSGKHNVANALAAYIVGLQLGMDVDKILDGLAQYHPTGYRQNFLSIGETIIYADCFNAAPDSVKAALDTLETLDDTNGEKIAVLGNMYGFGTYMEEFHREVGRYINSKKIDRVILYGENMLFAYEEINNPSIKKNHIIWRNDLIELLRSEIVGTKCMVLFKASLGIIAGVIDEVFEIKQKRGFNFARYRMQSVEKRALKEYFSANHIESAALYGLHVRELELVKLLDDCGVKVKYGIDRKAKYLPNQLYPIDIKGPDQDLEIIDMVIVTITNYDKTFIYNIKNKFNSDRVYSFEELYEKAIIAMRERIRS